MQDVDLWTDEFTRILFGRRQSRAVALFLAENPGKTTRQIAQALRISPVTARHHLRTLMEHGLVHRYPAGQTKIYEPDDALTTWVRDEGEAFERPWR